MELSTLIDSIHDNGNKLIILKAYVPLLGLKATALIMHLNTTIENGFQTEEDSDGIIWHKQNIKWMCRQSTLSEYGLRTAKKFLVELGLIYIKNGTGLDRTTYWRVNKEKLARFYAFAHALYAATRPDNRHTISQWHSFLKEYPDIVEEFRCLYPRLDEYRPDSIAEKAKKLNSQITQFKRRPDEIIGNKTKKIVIRDGKELEPCRFVEHWNKQRDTPKCRLGTKSYEIARRFFAAHRKYKAGDCSEFRLSPNEQERIELNKINRIPLDAQRRGPKRTAIRTDAQMFRHIEIAATAYQPKYEPRNKKALPGNLAGFLFNRFSKRYGTCSIFLERLGIFRPKKLDDSEYDSLLKRATKQELETLTILKILYDYANNKDQDTDLSVRELKLALDAARSIISHYENFAMDVHIIASHFRYYSDFLEWYRSYMEDEVWEGMPISALHPNKDLWRRFIDFINSDIGFDVFTGERVD